MKVDLHCHSRYSWDSFLEPKLMIKRAKEIGIDGICFTEHYSFNASCPVDNIETPDGFYIFRGVEISTAKGDILAYGVKDDSWNIWGKDRDLDPYEVIKNVHKAGGICVAAHPFRGPESLEDKIFELNEIDAVEISNGCNDEEANQKAANASSIMNLPEIGGSDAHKYEIIGKAYTVFEKDVKNIEELVAEIKAKRCKAKG